MAKVKKTNVVMYGVSGKIGDLLIFRQMKDGKIVVAKVPDRSESDNPSEEQIKHRKRFQQAVLYGKGAINNPETGELYKKVAAKRNKQPFNVAVADYFNAPDINAIDTSKYTGVIGDQILISASDDFMVKAVKVSIINSDGSLVEKGEATQIDGNLWGYVATQQNDNLEGDKIIVSASDLPGNVTDAEELLK
jgi:hypothetical protein